MRGLSCFRQRAGEVAQAWYRRTLWLCEHSLRFAHATQQDRPPHRLQRHPVRCHCRSGQALIGDAEAALHAERLAE